MKKQKYNSLLENQQNATDDFLLDSPVDVLRCPPQFARTASANWNLIHSFALKEDTGIANCNDGRIILPRLRMDLQAAGVPLSMQHVSLRLI